jgi:hypothetical protein
MLPHHCESWRRESENVFHVGAALDLLPTPPVYLRARPRLSASGGGGTRVHTQSAGGWWRAAAAVGGGGGGRRSGHAPRVGDDPLRMLVGLVRVGALVARARRLERRDKAAALGLEVLAARAALHVLLSEALLFEAQMVGASGERRGGACLLEAVHQKVLGPQITVGYVVRIEEEPAWRRLVGALNRHLAKEICEAPAARETTRLGVSLRWRSGTHSVEP